MRAVLIAVPLIAIAAAGLYWTQLRHPFDAAPSNTPSSDTQPLDLPPGGARFTIAQRSDIEVPGSYGRLTVHLGDITRNQVELSLHDEDGQFLIPPTSVRAGDRRIFSRGATRYELAILKLNNSLLGTDTAELELTAGPSQHDLIETLLRKMEESKLTFIRNGSEYDGAAAADHLRRKWKAAGDRVRTAEQFIEHLASRSSLSGKAYQVRLAEGTVMNSGDWLTARLREQD